MTEDESKKIKVELDHEQKVIYLGWMMTGKFVMTSASVQVLGHLLLARKGKQYP